MSKYPCSLITLHKQAINLSYGSKNTSSLYLQIKFNYIQNFNESSVQYIIYNLCIFMQIRPVIALDHWHVAQQNIQRFCMTG